MAFFHVLFINLKKDEPKSFIEKEVQNSIGLSLILKVLVLLAPKPEALVLLTEQNWEVRNISDACVSRDPRWRRSRP